MLVTKHTVYKIGDKEVGKKEYDEYIYKIVRDIEFRILQKFYDHLDFSGMIEESTTRTEQDIEDMINNFLDERNK